MLVPLDFERFVRFSLLYCNELVFCFSSCLYVNMLVASDWTAGPNEADLNISALNVGPRPQNIEWGFLENRPNGFELVSIIVGDNTPK
jgi:hypothetical protein